MNLHRICLFVALVTCGILQTKTLSAKNPFIALARIEKLATSNCKAMFAANLVPKLKKTQYLIAPAFRLLTVGYTSLESTQHELFCSLVNSQSCIKNQILDPLAKNSTHITIWIEELRKKKEELIFLNSGMEYISDPEMTHMLQKAFSTDYLLDTREILALEILNLEAKILGSQPDFFSKADQARIREEINQSIFRANRSIEALNDKVKALGTELTRLKPKN